VNWGFRDGFHSGSLTPAQFAVKAKAAGYRWVALEYNDYGNDVRCPSVKQACEDEGLIFGIWMTRSFTAVEAASAVQASAANFFIAEAEIPATLPQSQDWPALIMELAPYKIPKAVVSNTAAFTDPAGAYHPEVAAPLIADGWAYLSECYLSEAPHATPENQNWTVTTKLGWPETQPVAGLYGGKSMADYPTLGNYRGWSAWSAEYVL
jgi:hypothetical protein